MFSSYGVRIGVRATDARILERLPERLPPGWKRLSGSASPVVERLYSLVVGEGAGARGGARRVSLLYGDILRLARATDVEEILEAFETDLKMYVAEAARRRVFVHAGVVGWRGRAIVIPGRSLSGKTTLVAELVRAGATFYSDEYAVLDARGRVHPYAKPLAVRAEGRTGRQQRMPVEALGGVAGSKALPVGLVVVAEYRAGARWRPRTLTTGQGVLALLANTIAVRRQPEASLGALHEAVARAHILQSTRGEAGGVAASILESLKGDGQVEIKAKR